MPAPSFVDQVKVFVKAGDGGNGTVSFWRARYVPKGGPDGGDGGHGGDVIVRASHHKSTLYEFRKKRHFKAKNGAPGGGQQKTGKSGDDVIIEVPLGTSAIDAESGKVLGEVLKEGDSFVLQKGGRGGLGNLHFKTSTNQAPRKTTPGKKTEGFWLNLELKILADIGIIGKPNAGKSTLLSQISNTKSKVGDYPFTTLHPHLGVSFRGEEKLIFADMPGLIEGAHKNVGLGYRFLKHIERTQMLLFLIEIEPDKPKQSFEEYEMLLEEIKRYNPKLLEKKSLVALNKCDLLKDESDKEILVKPFRNIGIEPMFISARENMGIEEMIEKVYETYT